MSGVDLDLICEDCGCRDWAVRAWVCNGCLVPLTACLGCVALRNRTSIGCDEDGDAEWVL